MLFECFSPFPNWTATQQIVFMFMLRAIIRECKWQTCEAHVLVCLLFIFYDRTENYFLIFMLSVAHKHIENANEGLKLQNLWEKERSQQATLSNLKWKANFLNQNDSLKLSFPTFSQLESCIINDQCPSIIKRNISLPKSKQQKLPFEQKH